MGLQTPILGHTAVGSNSRLWPRGANPQSHQRLVASSTDPRLCTPTPSADPELQWLLVLGADTQHWPWAPAGAGFGCQPLALTVQQQAQTPWCQPQTLAAANPSLYTPTMSHGH